MIKRTIALLYWILIGQLLTRYSFILFLSLNPQHARSMTSQQCDQIHNQVAQVTNQIYSLQACENERLMRELHSVEQKIQNVERSLETVSVIAPKIVAAKGVKLLTCTYIYDFLDLFTNNTNTN